MDTSLHCSPTRSWRPPLLSPLWSALHVSGERPTLPCSKHPRAMPDCPAPPYCASQRVWLYTHDLPLKVPRHKLAPHFVRPFLISKVLNSVAICLKLPKIPRIHPTFCFSSKVCTRLYANVLMTFIMDYCVYLWETLLWLLLSVCLLPLYVPLVTILDYPLDLLCFRLHTLLTLCSDYYRCLCCYCGLSCGCYLPACWLPLCVPCLYWLYFCLRAH